MPDKSFDAVIIGGGNKGLFTAMYLAKYGGMDVGIFERRHELGGGLSSQESPAPGFIGDTHASTLFEWYYEPVEEDFPDFVEKGGKMTHYPTTYGIITKEDQKFFGIYHHSVDPTGEKTARELARFSERDAETYLKLFDVAKPGGSFSRAWNEAFFSVPPTPDQPDPVERWLQDYLKTPDCPIDLAWTMMPANRAVLELWDTVELQLMTLKRMKTMGMPTEMTGALSSLFAMGQSCSQSFAVGGTHSIAHACQRIFLENGGKFYTKSEVAKVLLEGSEAKGIRLADGTEIGARQLVVSAIDPHQLCFELVGREHLDRRLVRRLETVMRGLTCITWYTWAVHELPQYISASWNPDANNCHWTLLATKDLDMMLKEGLMRTLGIVPPLEGQLIVFGQHSQYDPTRAPEGKHVVATEQHVVPAFTFTERQWMDFKLKHAKETIEEWQKYAPNMNWDNVIGYDPITPYDTAARLKNMPMGDQATVDTVPGQMGKLRPIPELARYRTPIKNLYATGTAWNLAHTGTAAQGYACYKAIADDLGLAKPWKDKGRLY